MQLVQLAPQVGVGSTHGGELGHDHHASTPAFPLSTHASEAALQAIAIYRGTEDFPDHENNAGFLPARPHPKRRSLDPRCGRPGSRLPRHSDGQAISPLASSTIDNGPTARGAHPLAEAVLVSALSVAGLKGPFHDLAPMSICSQLAAKYPGVLWVFRGDKLLNIAASGITVNYY